MSYPDFGCFAECLVCELCDGLDDDDDEGIDLGLGDDFDGDDDGLGLDDWAPPEEPPGPFDDFEIPSLDLGPGSLSPDWNGGPGAKWTWEF